MSDNLQNVEDAQEAPATAAAILELAKEGLARLPILGPALWLYARDPVRRFLFVNDIDWAILPPVVLDQCRLYLRDSLPTLDFTSSLGRNYSSANYAIPTDYTTLGRTTQTVLQLTIPIFSGGGTNARVTEAIANRRKALADLEAARRQAAADAREAFAGIASGLAQIEAYNSAVESGEVAVKGNQAGYRVGTRINSDVLNAEQQLYSSKRDLTKARYDTVLLGLKLRAAAGVLGEEDVLAINALLGPRGAEGTSD